MSERDYVSEAIARIPVAYDQLLLKPEIIAAIIIAQSNERTLIALQANTDSTDDNTRAVRDADNNAWQRAQNR